MVFSRNTRYSIFAAERYDVAGVENTASHHRAHPAPHVRARHARARGAHFARPPVGARRSRSGVSARTGT